MDLSIVIVTYNARDYVRRCLRSVLEHTQGLQYESIVVDNASQDGTPEMVSAEFPQVRLLRLPNNAGFAAGVNRGVSASKGETLAILNPDTLLLDNAFLTMWRYLKENPEVGVLGPKLLDEDGSVQLSCRRFPGFATALFNRYSLLTRFFPRNRFSAAYLMSDWDHSQVREVDWLSGACWMVPRRAFDHIGALDEGYFMYIEDVDFCQRAHRAGWKVVYFPQVALVHHIGRSTGTLPNRMIIERHRSMWHYYKRYLRGPLLLLDGPVLLGIGARCALHLAVNNGKRLLRRV